jgi:non-specific serine/threonine protein kinase
MPNVATSMSSSSFKVPRAPKLFGRDSQEAGIRTFLLEDDVRLVTLTGAGGIGKTSLALKVAADLRGQFQDGVGFVPLAAIVDPALVLSTIARALAIPERPGSSPEADLVEALREREFLLILDNFEQVLPAARYVANLLVACERLKILATSRARLRIRDEQEYPVPRLTLPVVANPSRADASASPAVALFVARASRVDPGFVLTDANAPSVAEVCRCLDGLPLAIELAAARIKVLPPAAMLTRLDRRLPFLTDGPQDAPTRQQTLIATIAWSYDLLGVDDQALFRRLCCFAGGGSLHAIESIIAEGTAADADSHTESAGEHASAAGARPSRRSGLDGLTALVDCSLLWQEQQEDGEPRFCILETVREFGVDRLVARGEDRTVKSHHAAYYLAYAEAAAPRLRGPERTAWLDRLEREHDNLRSALSWFLVEDDAAGALRLAAALWQFWWWRSHLAEGRLRLSEILAMPGAEVSSPERARALTGAGVLTETQGDVVAADALHAESHAIWQQLGDARGLANSLLFRWLIALYHDDHHAMDAFASQSLGIFRQGGENWGTAMSLTELGIGAMRRYDTAQATAYLTEGRDLFRSIKDAWGEAVCTGVLGNISLIEGKLAQAAPLLKACLEALLQLNDQWGVVTFLPATARLEAERGRWERCVVLSGAVQALGEAIGAPLKDPFRRRYESNLARARQELASETYDAEWVRGRAMSSSAAVTFAFEEVAAAEPAQGVAQRTAMPPGAAGLTPREIEVLRLVNRTTKEIADALFVSPSTITTHLENIRGKLGLDRGKDLVLYAQRHGLL